MKVAVIGVGYWGPNLVRNLLALGNKVYIHDLDQQRMLEIAGAYPESIPVDSVDTILQDRKIEAVAIAVPLPSHAPLILRCLRSGKHVFVEKPLCSSKEECAEIESTMNGQVVMVGHITSFSPGVRKLIEMHRDGVIGDVRSITLTRTHLGPVYHQTDVLTEVAAHDLAILLKLVEDIPGQVQAWSVDRLGMGNHDGAYLIMKWSDGKIGRIDVQWTSALRKRELLVEGTEGSLFFEANTGKEKLTLYRQTGSFNDLRNGASQKQVNESLDVEEIPIEFSEPLRAEMVEFTNAIQEHRQPENDFRFAKKVVEVLESARNSMKRTELLQV